MQDTVDSGLTFYPRYACLCESNVSVCLSVRPSFTSRYCVKTKKSGVMISSPSGSPTILVFWWQKISRNCNGFPPREPRTKKIQKIQGGKIQLFFSFKHQYLENGSRWSQSYYSWL